MADVPCRWQTHLGSHRGGQPEWRLCAGHPVSRRHLGRTAAEWAVRCCIRTHCTVSGHPRFMRGCVRHLVVVSTLQAAPCCGWPLLLQLVRTMLRPALPTCAAPPGHHPYYPCQALWRHQAGRRRAGQGIWRRCSGLPASGTQDVCQAAGEGTGTAMSCCRNFRGRDTQHENCLACHLEGHVPGRCSRCACRCSSRREYQRLCNTELHHSCTYTPP